MRTIDADALKELFSEVIGHIAQKPEMNGNLEHMVRASAMVIQMIDDAPTVEAPDINVGNMDAISRRKAFEYFVTLWECIGTIMDRDEWEDVCMTTANEIPSVQPETNCSEIPNNSDTISRQQAIDALLGITAMRNTIPLDSAIFNIKKLPSAQPSHNITIHSDGRLWVTVDDIDKVNAVVVDESKSKFCKQFYMDAQPKPKRGKWILDRSGAYCCSECMEPCATYAMMKPRDRFCKMCGSRNEVME